MNTWITLLVQKYANKGIVIDTNVLLLLLVGFMDATYIENFKETAIFSIDDYETLTTIIEPFSTIITTPSILTEVSNLLERFKGAKREELLQNFAYAIRNSFIEVRHVSAELAENSYFQEFGLADTAIATLAKEGYLVITIDRPLLGLLARLKLDVINFRDLMSK